MFAANEPSAGDLCSMHSHYTLLARTLSTVPFVSMLGLPL